MDEALVKPIYGIPQWGFYLICIIFAAGMLLPAGYFQYPLSVDYLNHLSRMHIIFSDNNPFFQRLFTVKLEVIPNLALDASGMAAHALGIDANTFLKGFFIVSAVVMWGGIAECYRAIHGRFQNAFLLLLPLEYAFLVAYGFMDFVFAMGLFFFVFAWVIRTNPRGVLPVLILNLLGTAVFFCHFGAFLIMAVSMFLYRIGLASKLSRSVVGPLMLQSIVENVVPLCIYAFAYHAQIAGSTFSAVSYKMLMVILSLDVGSTPLAILMGIVFVAFLVAVFWARGVTLERRFKPLVAGFCLIALLAPFEYHGSFFIDTRLGWFVCLMFIMALDIKFTRFWIEPCMVGLAIGIVCLDANWVAHATSRYNADVSEFRQAITAIPRNSFVFVTTNRQNYCSTVDLEGRYYGFIPSLVTIDRDSVQPYIFTHRGMVAVYYNKAYEEYFDSIPQGPMDGVLAALIADSPRVALQFDPDRQGRSIMPYMENWSTRFSYVVYLTDKCTGQTPFEHLFQRVANGSFFDIYKTGARP
jgi:hypothetical protein